MKGERTRTCPYCGRPVLKPGPCSDHRPIEKADPLRGAMRGQLSERELGLVAPWPEGELEDDGAPA